MKDYQVSESEAQGAEAQSVPPPVSIERVREWLKRDMSAAINLLDAIYRDPDLMDSVADFMYGRYLNHIQSQQFKPKE